MEVGTQADFKVRFKTFELNLKTGELWQRGVKIRLYGHPIEVLRLLIEHAGEVVTRETLKKALWPEDVFVDFEHSLNSTINRLREALGDSAEAPRLIETIPRVGYRFIAAVEAIEVIPRSETPPLFGAASANGQRVGPERNNSARRRMARPGMLAAASATFGLLLLVTGIWFSSDSVRSRVHALMRNTDGGKPARIEYLAVLPLENLSGDPEQEYFSDGLTDTLITDLGRIGTMNVISRASVMRYKHAKSPMPQIAHDLNVDAVVEGTVLRSANRIRISIQLVDARSDRHLWAETYERDFVDAIQLEHLLALAIAHEISGRLSPAQELKLDTGRPTNMQAYDAYLQGRYLLGERTEEGEIAARAYFTEALRADPNFALAYSGLADTYSVGWFAKLDLPKAEEYARKAIELEPGLAEGHASLGVAQTYGLKLVEAGEELNRAVALNPNYAMAHHWSSMHELFVGNLSAALAENTRARQLDPYSLPINFMRGLILFHSHDFDRAIEQFQFASSISPLSAGPHRQIWRIYWVIDKIPEALAEQKRLSDLLHDARMSRDAQTVARIYERQGNRAALQKQAELAEEYYAENSGKTGRNSTYSAEDVARFYGLLGNRKHTLERLKRAFEEDSPNSPLVLTAPEFDFLHSDPEYQSLLGRAGLTPR